jgi:peptidoglycan-associated lipoprotein
MSRIALFLLLLFLQACAYQVKVRDGDTALDRYQFAHAITFYQKDMKKARTRVEQGRIALKIATAYDRMNEPAKALPYYQQAWSGQAGIQALQGKARSLKKLERYEEAIEAYTQLGEEIGSAYEYRREIQSCRLAMQWADAGESASYAIEGAEFNSRYADYAPFPIGPDKVFFTSDRPTPQHQEIYQWTGKPFADIFLNTSEPSLYARALDVINTPAHEGTLIMSPDRQEFYFTRCGDPGARDDQYCRIYVSRILDNAWTDPEPLAFCTGNFNYGHPALSADGNMLYYAADDPLGVGGYDLYMVLRTREGWTEPLMLPPTINTEGNEMFPWLDGDTLYFSSNHHPGMGGLDIFKSWRMGARAWAVPENLRPPINSGSDDFAFVWSPYEVEPATGLRSGYFSSTRPGGLGSDDIYHVREVMPPPPPAEEDTMMVYRFELHLYTLRRIYQNPVDPNSPILGRALLAGAQVRIQDGLDTLLRSNDQGPLVVEIIPGQNYMIQAAAEGYLSNSLNFKAEDIIRDPRQPIQVFERELVLEKRFDDVEIILENIYYDFDKWDIRSDAEPALNRLASLLRDNPDITIELASHTDCRGSAAYNQELSQKRAQSAVDYLIGQGIRPDRLRARGYGESRPAVDCICSRCTEEEHQKNRRTTFRILEN